jgi:uncharacterized protein YbbC (DUF1343 family)
LYRLLIWMCLLLGFGWPTNAAETPRVLNGIDVLREQKFAPLAGKRVGLITNHTGLAVDGTTTIDLLFHFKDCKLVALFSPEHGIRGSLDASVSSSTDESTGLPIYSLYGETRRPTPEMLNGIDALVFDIQDIGARFYTYITTMAYCMEAAAKQGIPFFVLDRPNPVGGMKVEGPMLDRNRNSFVGYMPLPVRHGMTVGELARYFNAENRIGAQLHVIKMKGWRRSYYFWDTGQLWVDTSPNMRNILGAILYPGICLLEGTNVSVGRGTDRPFEVVGAPWIEPRRLTAALQAAQLPGVKFTPIFFTPSASNNRGSRCGGVNIVITDAEKLNSVLVGLTLVSVLHRLYPAEFEIGSVIDLLGNENAMRRLKSGQSASQVLRAGSPEIAEFLTKRRKALIYDQALDGRKRGNDGTRRSKEKEKR